MGTQFEILRVRELVGADHEDPEEPENTKVNNASPGYNGRVLKFIGELGAIEKYFSI